MCALLTTAFALILPRIKSAGSQWDIESCSAYIIRSETVLSCPDSRTRIYISDGERVSAGQELGEIYPSQADLSRSALISELSSRRETLSVLAGEDGCETVYSLLSSVNRSSRLGEYSLAEGDAAALELYLGCGGDKDALNALIDDIDSQLASIPSCEGTQTLYAPFPGYASLSCDGFESVSRESLEEISPSELETLFSAPQNTQPAIRVAGLYNWYCAVVIPASLTPECGSSLTVSLSALPGRDFSLTVDSVYSADLSGNCVMVLSAQSGLEYILSLRRCEANIKFQNSQTELQFFTPSAPLPRKRSCLDL